MIKISVLFSVCLLQHQVFIMEDYAILRTLRHQARKHARSAHKVIRGSEIFLQYFTKNRVLRMWAGLNSGRS